MPSEFPAWDLSEKRKELINVEESYKGIFNREFRWRENPSGWGNLTGANTGYRAFIRAETDFIRELLGPSESKIAVDVSGGVGNYSIPLSFRVRAIFHCELDAESVQNAYYRSESDNIFFVRTPYLRLPFKPDIADIVLCTDTMIRGRNHEIKLLNEINRILKKSGTAIIDFHNRRLFRDASICLYNRREIKSLMKETGITQFRVYPFGYVPSMLVPAEFCYPVMNGTLRFFLPCQRYILVFTK